MLSVLKKKFGNMQRKMTCNENIKRQPLKNNILMIQSQMMPVEMRGCLKISIAAFWKKEWNPEMSKSLENYVFCKQMKEDY